MGGVTFTIRPMARADVPSVRELFERERELSEYADETLSREDLVAWVAKAAGALAGCVLSHAMSDDDGAARGGIDELIVASPFRGHGVARQLLETAEVHYRRSGARGMRLTVRDGNEPAQRLYASAGYTVVQRRLRMHKDF